MRDLEERTTGEEYDPVKIKRFEVRRLASGEIDKIIVHTKHDLNTSHSGRYDLTNHEIEFHVADGTAIFHKATRRKPRDHSDEEFLAHRSIPSIRVAERQILETFEEIHSMLGLGGRVEEIGSNAEVADE